MSLRTALSTPHGKQRYVRTLFATIADRYDFITRFLSCGQDRRWKQRLIALAALTPADRVLDLACGTGDLLFGAAPRVRRAVGLDVTFTVPATGGQADYLCRPHSTMMRGSVNVDNVTER